MELSKVWSESFLIRYILIIILIFFLQILFHVFWSIILIINFFFNIYFIFWRFSRNLKLQNDFIIYIFFKIYFSQIFNKYHNYYSLLDLERRGEGKGVHSFAIQVTCDYNANVKLFSTHIKSFSSIRWRKETYMENIRHFIKKGSCE